MSSNLDIRYIFFIIILFKKAKDQFTHSNLGPAGILAARLGDGDGTPTKPRGLQLGTKDRLFC